MKVPKIFIPEKDLDKNIEKMLKAKKKINLEKPKTNIDMLEIEANYSPYQFSFNGSLKRLREKKYERHLRPWEYFEILVKYYDGTLPEELYFSIDQMTRDYGEWFSMALEKKDKKLICYIDPKNLEYNKSKGTYIINKKLEYSQKKEFKIGSIPSKKWVPVTKFGDQFIEYFYNRQLEDMPEYVQETRHHFLIYLPPEDTILPVSRYYGKYGQFSMGCFNKLSHSRGAREKDFIKYLCPDKL